MHHTIKTRTREPPGITVAKSACTSKAMHFYYFHHNLMYRANTPLLVQSLQVRGALYDKRPFEVRSPKLAIFLYVFLKRFRQPVKPEIILLIVNFRE